MSEVERIAEKISSLTSGHWNKHYTKSKLKTDPLYSGVYEELQGREFKLLDIGCGMGILAMYLRERAYLNAVTGFDYDPRKIVDGNVMLLKGSYADIELSQGDARVDLPQHEGDVTILDILQFFEEAEQRSLLHQAAKRVAPGGKLIVRSGLREENMRFFITWLADVFAKCTFWMKAAPTHYPTADLFKTTLEAEGFTVDIRPFWGKTPFNNYLIVATRSE